MVTNRLTRLPNCTVKFGVLCHFEVLGLHMVKRQFSKISIRLLRWFCRVRQCSNQMKCFLGGQSKEKRHFSSAVMFDCVKQDLTMQNKSQPRQSVQSE